MKTIGYRDLGDPRGIIYQFNKPSRNWREDLFCHGQTRLERIQTALTDLQHTGNIRIFLIKGNKKRLLFSR